MRKDIFTIAESNKASKVTKRKPRTSKPKDTIIRQTKKPVVVAEACVCPVCNKQFNKTDEHKYIINNQYTCSWGCFTKYVKEHPPKPKIKRERKSNS